MVANQDLGFDADKKIKDSMNMEESTFSGGIHTIPEYGKRI